MYKSLRNTLVMTNRRKLRTNKIKQRTKERKRIDHVTAWLLTVLLMYCSQHNSR